MKNVPLRFLFSFLAILFVCAAYYPQNKPSYAETDICSLLDSPPPSESTVVRLKTLMTYSTVGRVDGGDPFFYSPKCNNEDYFAYANMDRTKLSKKHQSLFANLRSEKNFVFEIILEGRLETSFFPTFGHLSWSRASIQVDKFISITDVSNKPGLQKPNSQVEAPRIELARYLWTFNNEFLGHFFGISSSFKEESDLAEDFEAVDSSGRKFKRTDFDALIGIYRPNAGIDNIQIRQSDARMEGRLLIVTGNIKLETKQGEKRTVEYETTYIHENELLKLARFRILKG